MLFPFHMPWNSSREIDGVGQRAQTYLLFSAMLGSSAVLGLEGTGVEVYRWNSLNNLYSGAFSLSQVLGVSGSDLRSGDKECNYFPQMQMGSFDYTGCESSYFCSPSKLQWNFISCYSLQRNEFPKCLAQYSDIRHWAEYSWKQYWEDNVGWINLSTQLKGQ